MHFFNMGMKHACYKCVWLIPQLSSIVQLLALVCAVSVIGNFAVPAAHQKKKKGIEFNKLLCYFNGWWWWLRLYRRDIILSITTWPSCSRWLKDLAPRCNINILHRFSSLFIVPYLSSSSRSRPTLRLQNKQFSFLKTFWIYNSYILTFLRLVSENLSLVPTVSFS
jgi:hypothetical protein